MRDRWHLGHRLMLPIEEGAKEGRQAVVSGGVFSIRVEL